MGRRKSLFKLPFLKVKINSKTLFNIFGLLLAGAGIIAGISFFNLFSPEGEGKILAVINRFLIDHFGGLSIFIPLLIILFSGHFFNSKKLKVIKPNMTVGMMFVFVSLIGILQSGSWGKLIFENLSRDFTVAGTVIILTVTFVVGLILFLDTSIDIFLLFVIDIIKGIFVFGKKYIFASFFSKDAKDSRPLLKLGDKKKEGTFIIDKMIDAKPKQKLPLSLSPVVPMPASSTTATSPALKETAADNDIFIKPLSFNTSSTWVYPPMTLLAEATQKEADRGDISKNADVIEKTLDSFGIRARVSEVNYGPTVTQYTIEITMGTKLSKITSLGNDLALALAAPTGQVRIEAPIPGRSLVGIEIPNIKPQIVTLKQMLTSDLFANNPDPLLVPLGLDVSGKPQAASISKMPHVLIAGTTGSGKSVILNAWISTILFRTKPEDVRLILVDPKRVELTTYNDIPHLLTPVIVEPEAILKALKWTVKEMENRYKVFSSIGARNLESYNEKEGVEKKPYILFIIDELADIMMFAPGDAEDMITRIAQMARATGIHLVLAT
ncbi:MAG: DNA translocase FtsK, partial [bacterium]|nr:DNA translocase FtsK [bacterium]